MGFTFDKRYISKDVSLEKLRKHINIRNEY